MDGSRVRYKKLAFLARRQDLSKAQFMRHWKDIHGPTVAGAPGYAAWRDRYVQNHVIGPAFGGPFTYDGVAEFWLPAANEDSYALSETYQAHVRPDEANFIDFDRTISMTAIETVFLPGMSDAKLIILAQRASQLTPEAYAKIALARSRAASPALEAMRVSGSVDLVQDGSTRLPGARMAHEVPSAPSGRSASPIKLMPRARRYMSGCGNSSAWSTHRCTILLARSRSG